MRGSSSAAMPLPSSATTRVASSPAVAVSTADVAAGRRVLAGVVEQVGDDLLEPRLVREHPRRRQLGGNAQMEAAPRVLERREHVARDLGEVDHAALEDDLAGVEAGDVEHVVDQVGQPPDLALDHLRASAPAPSAARPGAASSADADFIALSGLRSSWPSIARNSSLAAFEPLGLGARRGLAGVRGVALGVARREQGAGLVERLADRLDFLDRQRRAAAAPRPASPPGAPRARGW
jgi:hypothetical protein